MNKDLGAAKRCQHLSPAFLAEAVGKLDAVFGSASAAISTENGKERYQDVTGNSALTDGTDTSG